MRTKRLQKSLFLALAMVLLAMFALALSACGNSGTYYLFEKGEYNKEEFLIIDGKTWTDDAGETGKLRITDGKIEMYYDFGGEEVEFLSGTIADGVITIKFMGIERHYCKEGSRPKCKHKIEIDRAIEPTCASVGKTEGKHCPLCGTVLVAQEEIPKKEHNMKNRKCTDCGFIEVISYRLEGDYYIVTGTEEVASIVIPSVHEGKPVKKIALAAFQNNKAVTSVEIPNSVTSIGGGAFSECESLTRVSITNGQ